MRDKETKTEDLIFSCICEKEQTKKNNIKDRIWKGVCKLEINVNGANLALHNLMIIWIYVSCVWLNFIRKHISILSWGCKETTGKPTLTSPVTGTGIAAPYMYWVPVRAQVSGGEYMDARVTVIRFPSFSWASSSSGSFTATRRSSSGLIDGEDENQFI